MQIRIITINTWKCDGDYYNRIKLLAAQLKMLTPHVVACQECFLSEDESIDTLRYLAEELDMYYHFTFARFKQREVGNKTINSYSGLGLLSAFPIRDVQEFDLPMSTADGQRCVQQAHLEIYKEKQLLLTNVHLTHLHNGEDLRKEQVVMLAENLISRAEAYNVVCGDFNATPQSDEITLFRQLTGAVDCYEAGGGTEPRTGYSNLPVKNVDHIFSVPSGPCNAVPTFVKSAIVLNEPDEGSGLYPSDHFGVGTTLITI